MTKILTFLLAFISLCAAAQTAQTTPPYASVFFGVKGYSLPVLPAVRWLDGYGKKPSPRAFFDIKINEAGRIIDWNLITAQDYDKCSEEQLEECKESLKSFAFVKVDSTVTGTETTGRISFARGRQEFIPARFRYPIVVSDIPYEKLGVPSSPHEVV